MVSPCECDGTQKFVHKMCLEKWIQKSGNFECNVCNSPYRIYDSNFVSFVNTHMFLNIVHFLIICFTLLTLYSLNLSISFVLIGIVLNCLTIDKIQDFYQLYEFDVANILGAFDNSLIIYHQNCLLIFFYELTLLLAKTIQTQIRLQSTVYT